ncbi:MAG: hypothetical protein IPJ65_24370 [Archangiaceae bacterium]|nr:hypothetical protein [Archangiaceae bacterium]
MLAAVCAAWLLSLAALVLPLVAAVVYALTSTACDPGFAVGFFPLLTLPSGLPACALGAFCGFTTERLWLSALLYLALLAATLAQNAVPHRALARRCSRSTTWAGGCPGPSTTKRSPCPRRCCGSASRRCCSPSRWRCSPPTCSTW